MNWPRGATISHSSVSMQAYELITDTIIDNEHAKTCLLLNAHNVSSAGG